MSQAFSPSDLVEAQSLLGELFAAVAVEEGKFSGGDKLDVGARAIQNLRQSKVRFGNPRDNLIRLTPKLFAEAGVELSEIRKRQMRGEFDFYYMTLAANFQPKRGAVFSGVECRLDFGPKGRREPILQAIFPKSEWKEVLHVGAGISLALNGDLSWEVKTSAIGGAVAGGLDLPADVKLRVANNDQVKGVIVVPEFAYQMGRSEIVATGEGGSECFWRIDKASLEQTQTVRFGVAFKVPKDTKTIQLTGLVAAEPSMNWLVMNLRYVFEELSEKLQRLLRAEGDERPRCQRLPIGHSEAWTLALPD